MFIVKAEAACLQPIKADSARKNGRPEVSEAANKKRMLLMTLF
jgi:hypothetical protein